MLGSKAVLMTLGFLLKHNCSSTLESLKTKVAEGGGAEGCLGHRAAHSRCSVMPVVG